MAYRKSDEDVLLTLVRTKDEQAVRTLYHRYIRYLSAICSRYICTNEDVKDILQESFIKIFTSIDSFEYRGSGSLKGWMARIVLNETLKFIKRNSRIDFVELKQDTVINASAVDTSMITDISLSVIHQMINELPSGYKVIFNLYVMEGKSHKEIAGLLSIKESTSASQLHRAKVILAKKIKNYLAVKSHNSL